jgi:GcrA cell cycle regulator
MTLMSQIAAAPLHPTPSHGRLASAPYPSPPATVWPEARVEALTRAWREGLSASQIARRLGGGLTRSAVIGKLHRLGLCGGAKPSAPRTPATATTMHGRFDRSGSAPLKIVWSKPVLDVAPAPVFRAAASAGPPPSAPGAKYLRDMGPRECRFGLGDPGAGNGALQLFCAAPTTGHPYCARHRAIVILPAVSLKEQKGINAELEALIGGLERRADGRPVDRRQAGYAR